MVLSLFDEVLAHFEELLIDFCSNPLDSFGRSVLGHRDASKTTIVGKRGTPRARTMLNVHR